MDKNFLIANIIIEAKFNRYHRVNIPIGHDSHEVSIEKVYHSHLEI